MPPAILFFIERDNGKKAGPYDIVQMAGLLRKNIINAETPVCFQGKDTWKPFAEYPQYMIAREMPASASSVRVDSLDAKTSGMGTIIPLPSMATIGKLCGALVLFAIAAFITVMIAMTNEFGGQVIVFGGGAIAMAAQALIIARLLDEGIMTILMVVLIPFYDVFYFITNLDVYYPYFAGKYLGLVLTIAAVVGLALAKAHGH